MLLIKSTGKIQEEIANRLRDLRLQNNISQKNLSERSGVSYGTIRRFESTGEISLKSLLKLAQVLDALKEFDQLFSIQTFTSLDELRKSVKKRKRGRN